MNLEKMYLLKWFIIHVLSSKDYREQKTAGIDVGVAGDICKSDRSCLMVTWTTLSGKYPHFVHYCPLCRIFTHAQYRRQQQCVI